MLNIRTALAAVACGTAALLSSAALAGTVRDAKMAFSIDFPGTAKLDDPADDLPDWVHRIVIWDQHDDNGYYNIQAVQTLPDNQTYSNLPGTLKGARDLCVVNDNVVSETKFDVPGGLGAEVLTRRAEFGQEAYDLVRFAAKGNKIYCVRGTYSGSGKDTSARAFVRSFRAL